MSKITTEDMAKYGYLFGYKLKLKESLERNRKISAEIDEIRKESRNLRSSNLNEFKNFKNKYWMMVKDNYPKWQREVKKIQ